MVLLGWLYMADILENPFGFNKQYDINLDEVDSDWLQMSWQKPGAGVEHLALLSDNPASERGKNCKRKGEKEAAKEDLGVDQACNSHLKAHI